MKGSRPNSLLGVAFEAGRVFVALVRRDRERLRLEKTLAWNLDLDPERDDPRLVGEEIRKRLREAGIPRRRCVLCLPVPWILSLHADLPQLSEADETSFLATHAERGFPFPSEGLSITASRYTKPGGGRAATQFAVAASRLASLQAGLRAAGLRVAAVTLGVAALGQPAPPPAEEANATLLAHSTGADLLVRGGNGILMVRRLEGGNAPGPDDREEDPSSEFVRHMRIALRQLPGEFTRAKCTLRLFGSAKSRKDLAALVNEAFGANGLRIEVFPDAPTLAAEGAQGFDRLEDGALLGAAAAAAKYLAGAPFEVEFPLPAKSQGRMVLGRLVSRRAIGLGAAALALILVGLGAILIQKILLARLEAQWANLRPRVEAVESLRDKVRTLTPWFSPAPETLLLLRALTAAFPERGAVWTTSVNVKNTSEVTVSGKATDRREWLAVQDRLRKTAGVRDLRVLQTRDQPGGNEPMAFSFTFRWEPGGSRGA